jgi:hypothetical protein
VSEQNRGQEDAQEEDGHRDLVEPHPQKGPAAPGGTRRVEAKGAGGFPIGEHGPAGARVDRMPGGHPNRKDVE